MESLLALCIVPLRVYGMHARKPSHASIGLTQLYTRSTGKGSLISLALRKETFSSQKKERKKGDLTLALARRTPHLKRASAALPPAGLPCSGIPRAISVMRR